MVDTVTISVEVPVKSRGEDALGKSMTDEDIAREVSYVLNVFLQDYCKSSGAKFGLVSANGFVSESEDF
ncbi:MAG TPA: hypothetical protein EYN14_07335 [Alphaproteobacteria bacterium]|nr:hypothetical protein [Alphaproteobacteria bacterium]